MYFACLAAVSDTSSYEHVTSCNVLAVPAIRMPTEYDVLSTGCSNLCGRAVRASSCKQSCWDHCWAKRVCQALCRAVCRCTIDPSGANPNLVIVFFVQCEICALLTLLGSLDQAANVLGGSELRWHVLMHTLCSFSMLALFFGRVIAWHEGLQVYSSIVPLILSINWVVQFDREVYAVANLLIYVQHWW